jgi:hypothetical protein
MHACLPSFRGSLHACLPSFRGSMHACLPSFRGSMHACLPSFRGSMHAFTDKCIRYHGVRTIIWQSETRIWQSGNMIWQSETMCSAVLNVFELLRVRVYCYQHASCMYITCMCIKITYELSRCNEHRSDNLLRGGGWKLTIHVHIIHTNCQDA